MVQTKLTAEVAAGTPSEVAWRAGSGLSARAPHREGRARPRLCHKRVAVCRTQIPEGPDHSKRRPFSGTEVCPPRKPTRRSPNPGIPSTGTSCGGSSAGK